MRWSLEGWPRWPVPLENDRTVESEGLEWITSRTDTMQIAAGPEGRGEPL